MWFIKNANTNEILLSITTQHERYSVGRMNSDLVLSSDTSISRVHCSLFIAKADKCPIKCNTETGVWLRDEGSKFGTFKMVDKDWIRIKPNENFQLNHKDLIRFGLLQSIFKIENRPLLVTTSMVPNQVKEDIKKKLKPLDGLINNNWNNNCMFVIVTAVTLTHKVVLAMINGIPIVTPDFLDKLLESIQKKEKWPSYEDFQPKIAESSLKADKVSLNYKNNRKNLFKNKMFYLTNKPQLNDLNLVIQAAGGKTDLLHSSDLDILLNDNSIFLQPTVKRGSASADSLNVIVDFLKKNERRPVPDSEIAQAIAYSSTEMYCNPKFLQFYLRKEEVVAPTDPIVVGETPADSELDIPHPRQVIQGSLTQSDADFGLPSPFVLNKKRANDNEKMCPAKRRVPDSGVTVFPSAEINQPSVSAVCPAPQAHGDSQKESAVEQEVQEDNVKLDLSSFQSKEQNFNPFWEQQTNTNRTLQKKRKMEDVDDLFSSARVKRSISTDSNIQRQSNVLSVASVRTTPVTKLNVTANKTNFYHGFNHAGNVNQTDDDLNGFINMTEMKAKVKKQDPDENDKIIIISMLKMTVRDTNIQKQINQTIGSLINVKPFKKKRVAMVNPSQVIKLDDMYLVQCGRTGEVAQFDDDNDEDDDDIIERRRQQHRSRKKDENNPFAFL